MAKATIDIEDLTPEQVRQVQVLGNQASALEGPIPTTSDDRDALIQEQLVQIKEREALHETGYKVKCGGCGAKFATKDAADAHVDSFHPEASEDAPAPARFAAPTPVEVVSTTKASTKAQAQPKVENVKKSEATTPPTP